MKKIIGLVLLILISLFTFQSCRQGPPIRMAEQVNLDLFMGDWYVIANIPTFIEKGAHNAVESYSRTSDKVIDTRFSFNKDSFTGPKKEYNPTGFVQDDPSNAEWKMQFLWPFKSEYIIVYVDPAYEYTIIGRTKRDYVWIMAREPHVSARELERLIQIAVDEGYDRSLIQMVPQQ
ncbi:lipocalin family protein [Marinicella sediminis]|uniref:Outer membrane lipoprotein Blc n=1 Tax=Marinicella sediminis TaxID=1792834 RepID=A0ABV7JG87_9GAMM|nr:lipocalin family protein [Marinicella sediminis]